MTGVCHDEARCSMRYTVTVKFAYKAIAKLHNTSEVKDEDSGKGGSMNSYKVCIMLPLLFIWSAANWKGKKNHSTLKIISNNYVTRPHCFTLSFHIRHFAIKHFILDQKHAIFLKLPSPTLGHISILDTCWQPSQMPHIVVINQQD